MNFSGTIYVQTEDRDAVVKAAPKCRVGLVQDGWIAVHPDLAGQDFALSARLARKLPVPMMHVVRHDELTMYAWYEAGRLVERYESDPQYFQTSGPRRQREVQGSPERLALLEKLTAAT